MPGTRRRISDYLSTRRVERPQDRVSLRKSLDVDQEELARITAEKTVAEYTRAIRSLLEELNRRIEKLEEEMREIRLLIEKSQTISSNKNIKSRFSRPSKLTRNAKILEEALDKYRVVMGSESRGKVNLSPHKLRELADELGALIIEAGGDFAVIMPEYFEEFKTILNNTKTSDPEEALDRMGPYRRMFEALRKAGLIYYDSGCGCWRMLL